MRIETSSLAMSASHASGTIRNETSHLSAWSGAQRLDVASTSDEGNTAAGSDALVTGSPSSSLQEAARTAAAVWLPSSAAGNGSGSAADRRAMTRTALPGAAPGAHAGGKEGASGAVRASMSGSAGGTDAADAPDAGLSPRTWPG